MRKKAQCRHSLIEQLRQMVDIVSVDCVFLPIPEQIMLRFGRKEVGAHQIHDHAVNIGEDEAIHLRLDVSTSCRPSPLSWPSRSLSTFTPSMPSELAKSIAVDFSYSAMNTGAPEPTESTNCNHRHIVQRSASVRMKAETAS